MTWRQQKSNIDKFHSFRVHFFYLNNDFVVVVVVVDCLLTEAFRIK